MFNRISWIFTKNVVFICRLVSPKHIFHFKESTVQMIAAMPLYRVSTWAWPENEITTLRRDAEINIASTALSVKFVDSTD